MGIVLNIAMPFITFAITEVGKYFWEKYATTLPPSVSMSLAGAIGALISQYTPMAGGDPVLGALLGALGAVVHDFGGATVSKVVLPPAPVTPAK